jgi:hypothetical protein
MTCGASGIQGMSIFYSGIQGIGPYINVRNKMPCRREAYVQCTLAQPALLVCYLVQYPYLAYACALSRVGPQEVEDVSYMHDATQRIMLLLWTKEVFGYTLLKFSLCPIECLNLCSGY